MRKIWLWSLVAGVVVLSGCGVLPQEEKVLSGDISQTGNETELSPAEALSWKEAKLTLAEVQAETRDTTPIVVITEANSGAIVTQTGDSLIYRNEVYGFQGKDGKVGRLEESDDEKMISLLCILHYLMLIQENLMALSMQLFRPEWVRILSLWCWLHSIQ